MSTDTFSSVEEELLFWHLAERQAMTDGMFGSEWRQRVTGGDISPRCAVLQVTLGEEMGELDNAAATVPVRDHPWI